MNASKTQLPPAPAGYRWLVEGDTIESTDQRHITDTGKFFPVFKHTVGQCISLGRSYCCHDTYNYVRPVPSIPGYRLLQNGETVQVGDLFAGSPSESHLGNHTTLDSRCYSVGQKVGAPGNFPGSVFFRKVEDTPKVWNPQGIASPGEGYRFLNEGETRLRTDEFLLVEGEWVRTGSPGIAVGSQCDGNSSVTYRRKVEAPAPKLPAGLRLLGDSETIQVGDYFTFFLDSLSDYYCGAQLGAHCDHMVGKTPGTVESGFKGFYMRKLPAPSPTPAPATTDFPTRRKIVRNSEPRVYAGDGYEFVPVGEKLLPTDEVIYQSWTHPLGESANVSEARVSANGPAWQYGFYRRKVQAPAAPSPASGSESAPVPASYRKLVKGEKVRPSDHILRPGGLLDPARGCASLDWTVGDLEDDLTTRPFIRKVKSKVIDRSKVTIPEGYQELEDGELMFSTDRYLDGKGWSFRFGTHNDGRVYRKNKHRITIRRVDAPTSKSHTEVIGRITVSVERDHNGTPQVTIRHRDSTRAIRLGGFSVEAIERGLQLTK